MASIAVNVRRKEASLDLQADLQRARWLANLLDARFSVGGIRFGLDAIVGLIPGVGDVVALATAGYPLHLVKKHNLPRKYARRMTANIAIDFVGGLVPLLGDVFDVYYKANLKNLALLEKAVAESGEVRA
jgi:hypothetical protein